MNVGPELIFIVILLVWSGILTFLFFKFFLYYSHLAKHGHKGNLAQVLDELIQGNADNKKDIRHLISRCDTLEKEGQLHIQKVGLLRFNPFKDTGGDQSFILALVDAHDTGVVVSGLHTRSGTRWYAKKVINGKGTEYELSEDEIKAIKEARANFA